MWRAGRETIENLRGHVSHAAGPRSRQNAVRSEEIQARLSTMGAVPMQATQVEFARYVADDIAMYRDFIRANPEVLKAQ